MVRIGFREKERIRDEAEQELLRWLDRNVGADDNNYPDDPEGEKVLANERARIGLIASALVALNSSASVLGEEETRSVLGDISLNLSELNGHEV